jgi:hypothetical protein
VSTTKPYENRGWIQVLRNTQNRGWIQVLRNTQNRCEFRCSGIHKTEGEFRCSGYTKQRVNSGAPEYTKQGVNSGAPEYTNKFSLKKVYVCRSSVLYIDWNIILMYYPNYYLFLFYIVICTYLYFRCTAGTPPVCAPDVKEMNILYNKGDIYLLCYFWNGWTPYYTFTCSGCLSLSVVMSGV